MTQRDLFSAPSYWLDEEQIFHAERCAGEMGGDIIRWAQDRWARGALDFHMEELRRRFPDRAPDSAGRILRLLRQKGVIDYVVVNRGQSHYRLVDVPKPEEGER